VTTAIDTPLPDAQAAGLQPLLLTVQQTAQLVGLSVRVVWRMVSGGEFPRPRHVGRSARWLHSEILEWTENLE